MPARDTELRELVGRLAAAERWGRPEAANLRHQLAVERAAIAIEGVAHDLTDDELLRLVDTVTGRPSGHEPAS